MDYRKLNKETEAEFWPLPRIQDILDRLAISKWFTTMDFKSGYYQIKMSKESSKYAAFYIQRHLMNMCDM